MTYLMISKLVHSSILSNDTHPSN